MGFGFTVFEASSRRINSTCTWGNGAEVLDAAAFEGNHSRDGQVQGTGLHVASPLDHR